MTSCGSKALLAVRDKPLRLAVQGVGARFRQEFDSRLGAGRARRGIWW